jgi:hypothetical protein
MTKAKNWHKNVPAVGAPWREQGGDYLGVVLDSAGKPLWHMVSSYGDIEDVAWGQPGVDVPDACSDVDGLANTKAMSEAGSGAAICVANLNWMGFEDWYIPAPSELLMQIQLTGSALRQWTFYWSSKQYTAGSAWALNHYGTSNYPSKRLKHRVRPVRRVAL